MSWGQERLTNSLNGKTLAESKKILEQALLKYYQDSEEDNRHVDEYSAYYTSIIESKIPVKNKKSLINALHKFGVGANRYGHSITVAALEQQNISLLKYVCTLSPLKQNSEVVSFCKEHGRKGDTLFVIQLLSNIKVSLTIVKAFLYSAIVNRNMSLIKFIVEQLKTDIYVPTHRMVNHALGPAFVQNDDLELLQWFEEHDYNIHESQRALLTSAYQIGAKRLVAYVLEKQAETDAADIYMERVSEFAFYKGDVAVLQKFPKINFRVTQGTIVNALNSKKDLIYMQILFNRYIEIHKEKVHKYHYHSETTPEGDEAIFTRFRVAKFHDISQYNLSVWQYIKNILYKYGDPLTRARLISAGYITGVAMPTNTAYIIEDDEENGADAPDNDEDDEDDEENAAVVPDNDEDNEDDEDVSDEDDEEEDF